MSNQAVCCCCAVLCCAVLYLQVADIDFFDSQPFPSFDVITMGMILHDWGIEKKRMLMQKVSCS